VARGKEKQKLVTAKAQARRVTRFLYMVVLYMASVNKKASRGSTGSRAAF
jgi:hypothetical protein